MSPDLTALLIPPQEQRLRARFGLRDAALTLITSGWQKLIIGAPDRVFAFPRGPRQVPMVEREADVLGAVSPEFAPNLLGLHRDSGISPYPFLELTRIPGAPWDQVERRLAFDDATRCLEQLARRVAVSHRLHVPERLAERPEYLDNPRITEAWIDPAEITSTAAQAISELSPYLGQLNPAGWTEALEPIATMSRTAVHGELSRGQFLVDDRLRITGIVDWDGLHVGHPLLDLDFGVDLYRIYQPACDRTLLRRRIWNAYADERGGLLPEWHSVRLFWSIVDALTVLHENDYDRVPQAIADVRAATRECA